MTIETFAAALFVVCLGLAVLCVFLFFRCWSLEGEAYELHKSKDTLRESMSNTNRYLQQQLERVKKEKHEQRKKLTAEIHALRTQLHQLRKEQQKQDN